VPPKNINKKKTIMKLKNTVFVLIFQHRKIIDQAGKECMVSTRIINVLYDQINAHNFDNPSERSIS
jgi:hypothetical protein